MTRALATSSLTLTEAQEDQLLRIAEDLGTQARRAQGLTDASNDPHTSPAYRSWLWWRECATKALENEYSWRLAIPDDKLWEKSNVSMQSFTMQVMQHYVEIKQSMLKSHRFFTHAAEGADDDTEAIKRVQRRLHYRSKVTDFKSKMENAVLSAMALGEQVLKPSLKQGARIVTKKRPLMVYADGSPVLTSQGGKITDDDEWFSTETGSRMLMRDRKTLIPMDIPITPTPDKHDILFMEPYNDGASFDCLYYRDFICDPRWPTIEAADYKAHEFAWTFDQIREYLAPFDVNQENLDRYREDHRRGGSSRLPAAASSQSHYGEDEQEDQFNSRTVSDDSLQPLIRLREEYIRADILDLKFRQDIFLIRDVESNIPICYALAQDVVTWNDKGHPFEVIRSSKVKDRWYGSGYFKGMYDDCMSIDRTKNQIELEIANSGNILVMDKNAIKNVKAGGKLHIRSSVPNVLESGASIQDALQVTTIVPQIGELDGSLQLSLANLRTKYGQMSPGESGQGMDGADTATGMAIIENKGNAHVNNVKHVLGDGIDKCVEVFARIELLNIDEPDLINQMGQDDARIVIDFISSNKDNFINAMETMLATQNSATMLQANQQVLTVLQQWIVWPPEYQEIHRPAFENVLLGLDVNDPRKLLETANEAQLKMLAKQQQLGMPGAAPPPGVGTPTQGAPIAPTGSPPDVAGAGAGADQPVDPSMPHYSQRSVSKPPDHLS